MPMNKPILLFSILSIILFLATPTTLAVPEYKGYVNDYAGILGEWKPQIEELITSIEKETTAEIAIVTIESLADRNLEEYSLEIAETWGIGKEDKDNGLLLLISLKDKKYRFETGYGLEGTLPDAKTGRIGRQVLTPYFQQGRYGQGVYEALKEIKGLLANDPSIVSKYTETPQTRTEQYRGFILLGYAIILFITLVATEHFEKHKWKIRTGTDIAVLASGAIFGILGVLFAVTASIFFWILAAQVALGKRSGGHGGFWWGGFGHGGSSGSSGGFGGFGGGSFGGGGSSGGW